MTNPNVVQTKNRADLSQFLIHLTKNGTYEELRLVNGAPQGYEEIYHPVEAKDSLIKMISNLKIEARSSFGYFKLKINMYRPRFGRVFKNGDADPNWMRAVCFSETPLAELKNFYQAIKAKRNKYQKYGLAFWQDNVRKASGNPVFYVDSRRIDLKTTLDTTYMEAPVSKGTVFTGIPVTEGQLIPILKWTFSLWVWGDLGPCLFLNKPISPFFIEYLSVLFFSL